MIHVLINRGLLVEKTLAPCFEETWIYTGYTSAGAQIAMPKTGAYHHGNLRVTLMALARATLEQDGPEAIALRELAERAGVSNMAPYRHFADKAALLEAVAAQGFAELRHELLGVDNPRDPTKALVAFGVAYVRFATARPGLFRLMYGGPSPAPADSQSDDPSDIEGLFTQRLARFCRRRKSASLFSPAGLSCTGSPRSGSGAAWGGRRKPPLSPNSSAKS